MLWSGRKRRVGTKKSFELVGNAKGKRGRIGRVTDLVDSVLFSGALPLSNPDRKGIRLQELWEEKLNFDSLTQQEKAMINHGVFSIKLNKQVGCGELCITAPRKSQTDANLYI